MGLPQQEPAPLPGIRAKEVVDAVLAVPPAVIGRGFDADYSNEGDTLDREIERWSGLQPTGLWSNMNLNMSGRFLMTPLYRGIPSSDISKGTFDEDGTFGRGMYWASVFDKVDQYTHVNGEEGLTARERLNENFVPVQGRVNAITSSRNLDAVQAGDAKRLRYALVR